MILYSPRDIEYNRVGGSCCVCANSEMRLPVFNTCEIRRRMPTSHVNN